MFYIAVNVLMIIALGGYMALLWIAVNRPDIITDFEVWLARKRWIIERFWR